MSDRRRQWTDFRKAVLLVLWGIALAPAVGVGILTSENANGGFLSAALAAPFTLVAGMRVIPYVTPAIGVGTVTADVDVGGSRAMLGGGIAIITPAAWA